MLARFGAVLLAAALFAGAIYMSRETVMSGWSTRPYVQVPGTKSLPLAVTG